jgi:urease accessory protein
MQRPMLPQRCSGTLAQGTLGNLATYDVGSRTLERIEIASDDLAKRLLRLRAAGIARSGCGSRTGAHVRDGDVIFADDARVIAVAVAPDVVLVCRPQSIAQALAVAHALGNRHLPVQIDGDALVVRDDRLVEDLLREMDVPFAREPRRLSRRSVTRMRRTGTHDGYDGVASATLRQRISERRVLAIVRARDGDHRRPSVR